MTARVAGVSGGRIQALLILALEAPDLFAGQLQLLRDRVLGDALPAGVGDGAPEIDACLSDEFAGVFLRLLVCLARGDYITHRIRHPFMVSRVGLSP